MANAGVVLAVVPGFPKNGANGVARWHSAKKALIQLSLRFKWADIFWSTFFQEAKHITDYTPKDVIIDFDEPRQADDGEVAADQISGDYLINPDLWSDFVKRKPITEARINRFADSISISLGVVVGRLQHENVLQRNRFNHLRQRFHWTNEHVDELRLKVVG